MTSMINSNDNFYELQQEYQKLATLVPILPKDQCLSELEFIEFVIIYIRQLQNKLLEFDQFNEHNDKQNYFLLSTPTYLFNQLSEIQTDKSSSNIRRNPLAPINPDNTRLF
ncbi:unnamed protein product [Adineta steineri]|uniref:BHLH domain-containing protein n=2 Tax=Adineta steineri TaxID=433720 RepID=A0A814NM38_9BILA|nr:unnamed protein product [Adineta steineri]CAF1110462.1 unnamed protein product [Adineta steineri]